MTSALISAKELHMVLNHAAVKVLDASYKLPPSDDGIPGAVDFDIDDIADTEAPLPHTVPTVEQFTAKVGKLGVGGGDPVVVYDRAGISMAASRVWWMFRLFGHDNVRILDGGLPAWTAAGYPLAPKNKAPTPRIFRAILRPQLLRLRGEIESNLGSKAFTVVDARAADRYAGAAPEPRPGLEPGHIPGSVNVPFASLIDPATGKLKPRSELPALLNVDRSKPIACSCGSGVTACVVALALFETGTPEASVYDGSWAEWGADPALPKTSGKNP
jgi:thiosulfate/3-mercaptopyruvate sulfurtransferase